MVRRHGKEPALPEVVEHVEPETSRNRVKSGSPSTAAVDLPRDRDPYRSRLPPRTQEETARQTHSRYESRTERPVPQSRPVETHRPPDIAPVPPFSSYHTTPPRAVFQPPAPAPAPVPIQSEVRPYTQTAPLPPIESTRQTAPAPPLNQSQSQLDTNKRGFLVSNPASLHVRTDKSGEWGLLRSNQSTW